MRGLSVATVTWDIPADATPGIYRIQHFGYQKPFLCMYHMMHLAQLAEEVGVIYTPFLIFIYLLLVFQDLLGNAFTSM